MADTMDAAGLDCMHCGEPIRRDERTASGWRHVASGAAECATSLAEPEPERLRLWQALGLD